MMNNRSAPQRHHSDAIEIELIRSLFHAFVPSVVMTFGFMAAGGVLYARTGDTILLGLLIVGTLTSVARLMSAWLLAPAIHREDITLLQARALEWRFAIPYVGFALVLGLFGWRVFLLPGPEMHMLATAMLVTYCAGVAVGMGVRLRVAVPSMILSLAPALCVSIWTPDALYRVVGGLVGAALVSAIQSLRARHERSVQDIGLRLTFSHLARKDALTALPNRIALREWYAECVVSGKEDALIAVHYLDLNGFKPVNDTHGHPVGDALLTAVGRRIAHTIRETDIVARLGGDEFAVIQYDIHNADEAALLAGRLTDALARPFRIRKLTLKISTGLGYVVARGKEENLDDLLGRADEALYQSKHASAVVQYDTAGHVTRKSPHKRPPASSPERPARLPA